jgi:hypothetical protein
VVSSGFSTKILYEFLTSPTRATCPLHLILLDFITLIMYNEIYSRLLPLTPSYVASAKTFVLSLFERVFKDRSLSYTSWKQSTFVSAKYEYLQVQIK